MNREERLAFVRAHRTAVFGVNRRHDGPAMSIVYYVMNGNDILASTMEARGKAKAVRRNPKVSLCVLDEQWPLTYLQLYCNATIDATVGTDLETVVELGMRISGLMAGSVMPESMRNAVRERVIAERRVQLRLRPYTSFESSPRHVYSPGDAKGLTHDLGQSLPW